MCVYNVRALTLSHLHMYITVKWRTHAVLGDVHSPVWGCNVTIAIYFCHSVDVGIISIYACFWYMFKFTSLTMHIILSYISLHTTIISCDLLTIITVVLVRGGVGGGWWELQGRRISVLQGRRAEHPESLYIHYWSCHASLDRQVCTVTNSLPYSIWKLLCCHIEAFFITELTIRDTMSRPNINFVKQSASILGKCPWQVRETHPHLVNLTKALAWVASMVATPQGWRNVETYCLNSYIPLPTCTWKFRRFILNNNPKA